MLKAVFGDFVVQQQEVLKLREGGWLSTRDCGRGYGRSLRFLAGRWHYPDSWQRTLRWKVLPVGNFFGESRNSDVFVFRERYGSWESLRALVKALGAADTLS